MGELPCEVKRENNLRSLFFYHEMREKHEMKAEFKAVCGNRNDYFVSRVNVPRSSGSAALSAGVAGTEK